MIPRRAGLAYLFGLGSSLTAALIAYVITVQVSSSFGTMLFVALPFGMGFWSAFSITYHEPARSRASAIGYGCLTIIVALLVLLTTAWEGMACVVMATPILLVCAALGGWLGWSTARQRPLAQTLAPLLVPAHPRARRRRPGAPARSGAAVGHLARGRARAARPGMAQRDRLSADRHPTGSNLRHRSDARRGAHRRPRSRRDAPLQSSPTASSSSRSRSGMRRASYASASSASR